MSYFENEAAKVRIGQSTKLNFLRLNLSMKGLKYIFLFLFGLTLNGVIFASHNRAGEIVYQRVDSNPFKYQITIITYTKTGGQSDDADRCFLVLNYGDGQSDTVYRNNGPSGTNCNHLGQDLGGNTKKNTYTTTHIYPGAGKYTVFMQDQNRNAGVKNIPNSDNVWFYIESEIVIDLNSGGNSAPRLQNPPIDNGCVNQVFLHNPGAVDPDGDSLVYSLVASKTQNGATIPGYVFPNQVSIVPSTLTINNRTGTLSWDAPREQGEYNVAIRIEEWRYNENSGDMAFVGSTLRDMQININTCEDKSPPVINDMQKQCVQAGKVLRVLAIASDQDQDNIDFSATGYPLEPDQGGSLDPDGITAGESPVSMEFIWNTNCSHVQYESYWVYFKAKENLGSSEEELVDFEELEIQVVAPPVDILSVTPAGASLILNWTIAPCEGADGYDIYRYNDSLGYVASNCNTGVPESLGYIKIGRNNGIDNTSFTDDSNGNGLIHGQRYCYMIVATYPDRSESYASLEACGELIRDVPILNKASVGATDLSVGVDSIAWYKPIELKTNTFAPPYSYQLSRATNGAGPFEIIYNGPESNDFLSLDTQVVVNDLNTEELQYFYSIELLAGPNKESVGKSRNAATIYLESTPSDNTLTLNWNVNVPWSNTEYVIYKFKTDTDSLDVYYELARTSETTYVDEGLVNLKEYRYFVKSIGSYSAEDLRDTLVNFSQIHTGIPKDLQAPCTPPNRLIEGDCNLDQTTIRWNNPNNFCEGVDDVLGYHIYYAPQLGQTTELVQVNASADDTIYVASNLESIAGCYFVTAIDSFDNESETGEALCIDNCPIYELPNVFTPGNDGTNDYFIPFPYKFIESINITIYNRWGNVLFESTDPDINWDGTDMRGGNPVPDGTYFYVCTVNEIRLVGIVAREIRGSFTIIRERDKQIAK